MAGPAVAPDVPPAEVTTQPSSVAVPSHSRFSSWACVATVETGGDYRAHGPSYSSAFGAMNEAVRENAPPPVAARILAGTASQAEQIAMAESILAKHGVGAWGVITREKCAV